jgi:hypothetical protein
MPANEVPNFGDGSSSLAGRLDAFNFKSSMPGLEAYAMSGAGP